MKITVASGDSVYRNSRHFKAERQIHYQKRRLYFSCFYARVSSFSQIRYLICLNTYAPKATETPAAEAADKISLFFASFRPYLGNR